jgi:hypothetical protein
MKPFTRSARIVVTTALVVLGLPMAAYANGPLAVCEPGRPFLWPLGGADIPFNPDQ